MLSTVLTVNLQCGCDDEAVIFNESDIDMIQISRLKWAGNVIGLMINNLTPNGHFMGRTAQLTSRCNILYIYSTNIRTEYFKHAA